jgi:hypothetical protein
MSKNHLKFKIDQLKVDLEHGKFWYDQNLL